LRVDVDERGRLERHLPAANSAARREGEENQLKQVDSDEDRVPRDDVSTTRDSGTPDYEATAADTQCQPEPNKKAQMTQGLRATAVRVYRHLVFLKFESCTVSSALLENPTLEPNSTSIGKPVAKLWPFLYIQHGRQPPSWILSNRK